MKARLRIIGIRHHSPACARLVARELAASPPALVLVEGPSDFNSRIGELGLAHRPPIALYSYVRGESRLAQCWFPFLDYSPEWVALGEARRLGIPLRFIDLPHWHYRAREGEGAPLPGRDRYGRVSAALCRRLACDGDDALWDRLFEGAPEAELAARLDQYFGELRGDDPGSPEDQAREDFMARHVAAVLGSQPGPVLVICGGWHRPVLEARVQALLAAGPVAEPQGPCLPEGEDAGAYLVPCEFRQVEALAGYGAGMPSPLFYQWCWELGPEQALERARATVLSRLRGRQVNFSTADCVALESALQGLARLRGHQPPQRVDLLDALLMAGVKEALEQPPPWSGRDWLGSADHPLLREALLALTGEGRGQLDDATPQPPLLRQVEALLAELELLPGSQPRQVSLDRRQPGGQARSRVLWRLSLLELDGVRLQALEARHGARQLSEALRYEERWQLQRGLRWEPDLIEASRFGPTLEQAAGTALLRRLLPGAGARELAEALVAALRADLTGLGRELQQQLQQLLPGLHQHGELAAAGLSLLELARTGFWGQETRSLLEPPLALLGERLLWLLEGHQAQGEAQEADVAAVEFLAGLLDLAPAPGADGVPLLEPEFILATLMRLARQHQGPPALAGAALGALHARGRMTADAVLALVRAQPARERLGDFLYGLFSRTRELAVADTAIVAAIQGALAAMTEADFLVLLPRLRAAFAWFPPRERGGIAARVAEVLGLSRSEEFRLLRLPGDGAGLLEAKRMEARALAWARAYGVLP